MLYIIVFDMINYHQMAGNQISCQIRNDNKNGQHTHIYIYDFLLELPKKGCTQESYVKRGTSYV